MGAILKLAREKGIVVQEVPAQKLDELCAGDDRISNHQGIAAYVSQKEYCEIGDILEYALARGEAPFIIILDGLTDAGNVGAVIRSAECMGAHGLIMGKHRAAPINAAVAKASSGAVEHIRIARVTNLNDAVRRLKDNGVFVYAVDMDGQDIRAMDITGAAAFVIGAEGSGVSRRVKENCDASLSIPMFGRTQSLNASAAAGIIMYEKRRQETS
jgi:23S rRNA (guanosine2251-2'-O)-methyltransferase